MFINNQVVEVDQAIQDQVRLFNELGYKTHSSCSGHPWRPADFPYIAFNDYNFRMDLAAPLCGLEFKDNRHNFTFWKMAVYGKKEGDTEGFLRSINDLLKILLVIKMVEDKLEAE